ncbi:MAG: TnpV protein [Defluviitaleaceae bacterium]|nr:TnpV protein [Defluviitaleaceae bacterium]
MKEDAMLNITCSQIGDYLLPDIVLSEPSDAEPLTKYGMMPKNLLEPVFNNYQNLPIYTI